MNDSDLIIRLADAVAKQIRPPIPVDIDLWDIATIAQLLKRDSQVVRERMACMPDFPKAIRLPTKTGRAQPLYNAKEVIAWVQSYKEKNQWTDQRQQRESAHGTTQARSQGSRA